MCADGDILSRDTWCIADALRHWTCPDDMGAVAFWDRQPCCCAESLERLASAHLWRSSQATAPALSGLPMSCPVPSSPCYSHSHPSTQLTTEFMDRRLFIHVQGGRQVSGILRGFDMFLNLVLDQAYEEIPGGQRKPAGMVVSICSGVLG